MGYVARGELIYCEVCHSKLPEGAYVDSSQPLCPDCQRAKSCGM